MAKRNLNEVLGFISRWGNSNFSSRLIENNGVNPKKQIDDMKSDIDSLKQSLTDPASSATERNAIRKQIKSLTGKLVVLKSTSGRKQSDYDAKEAAKQRNTLGKEAQDREEQERYENARKIARKVNVVAGAGRVISSIPSIIKTAQTPGGGSALLGGVLTGVGQVVDRIRQGQIDNYIGGSRGLRRGYLGR